MRNIIIVGPSRAGKTTLAKRLSEKFNYFVISLDKLDVRLNWNRNKAMENIAPFIGHFLGTESKMA